MFRNVNERLYYKKTIFKKTDEKICYKISLYNVIIFI